jgi:hypothetical protein
VPWVIAARRQQEDGFALVAAVLLMLIVTVVLGVVVAHMTGGAGSANRAGARVASMDDAGAGIQALQQALVAGRNADFAGATQGDGMTVGTADLAAAAATLGGTLVTSPTHTDIDGSFGGMAQTIKGPVLSDGSWQMWQVVQALQPNGVSPWLTLYMRSWRETSSGATDASVARVRLRPGSMADYQLLSDVPINIDAGAKINGRVHSNGSLDEWSQPPPQDLNLRIWSSGTVTCTPTAGVTPIISTGRGTIGFTAPNCDTRPDTGTYVPLDAAKDAVVRMRRRAGVDVTNISYPGMPAGPAVVSIFSTSVQVQYPGRALQTISTPSGSTRAIVIDRDVVVHGTTSARLTIAAWSITPGQVAPTITIDGNVGRSSPTATVARSLGLLAEGDIAIVPNGTRTIQAALFATTGGVRLPWNYRTPTRDPNLALPHQSKLTIVGSIASHSTIAPRWSWGAGYWVGFSNRDYSWDGWLATYPPPYWPTSNPWELIDQSDANADCFGATGKPALKGTTACR